MRCGNPAAGAPVTDWVERAAVGASLLCLIHCAGLPLLLAALPALSRLIFVPEQFHFWVLVFALPTSAAALLVGTRRHRRWLPLVAGGLGLALLTVGALLFAGDWPETPLTLAGSGSLILGHLVNWRLRRPSHGHG